MTDAIVAVLGTGSIGRRHLAVLKTLGIRSIAVPVRPDRAGALAADGWEVAGSLDEAASRGARAAVIATDTLRHVPDTLHALRLGLDVLCEKPLAEDALSAGRLPDRAGESAPRLFVAYCLRFDRGLGGFRARLASIGDIHSARIECRSFLPGWRPHRDYRESYSARASEGGVLRDLCHEVDYACWLFGFPEAVSGMTGNTGRLGIESEEIAEAFWVSPGGVRVSVGLDYLSDPPSRFVRAHGSLGMLEYDFHSRRLVLRTKGGERREERMEGDPGDMYAEQMRRFLQAASGGDPGVLATGGDGRKALALCDAWRRSSASGRREVLSS
ncbi:MAG: Gfo/Idh/MocA family oxidoreductase [Thermodesulfobacteriota bacterium]